MSSARKIDEDDNANDWLMIPLVDRLVAAGVLLKPGECYSFLTPPSWAGITPLRTRWSCRSRSTTGSTARTTSS